MKRARVPAFLHLSGLPALLLTASSLLAADHAAHLLLDAHFDDKPPGQPLGTGGAVLGEPTYISPALQAVVAEDASNPGNHLLDLSGQNLAGTAAMHFDFLDNAEVNQGLVRASALITLPTAGFGLATLYLREHGSNMHTFTTMTFFNSGIISVADNLGTMPILPMSIPFDQPMQVEIIHDLDQRSYDVLINGVALVQERAHGVEARGIGRIGFGLGRHSDSVHGQVLIDDVVVAQLLPDAIFGDGFELPR